MFEAVIRRLPKALQRPFPLKTASFEEFLARLPEEGVAEIVGMGEKAGPRNFLLPASSVVGHIGDTIYSTRLESVRQIGRSIILEETWGRAFGSTYGFADAQERGVNAIRTLLTAADRLATIKERYPHVEVHLSGLQGIMNDQELARLHQDASRVGATKWERRDQLKSERN